MQKHCSAIIHNIKFVAKYTLKIPLYSEMLVTKLYAKLYGKRSIKKDPKVLFVLL